MLLLNNDLDNIKITVGQTVTTQTGTYTQLVSSGTTYTPTIVFNEGFATIPSVSMQIVSASDNNPDYGTVEVTDVTRTGFTCKLTRRIYGTATFSYKWVASAVLYS